MLRLVTKLLGEPIIRIRTITTPFKTAMPKSAMNPTPAEIENGISRNASASMPPTTTNGIPV
jgi:hypothetical protein